MVMATAAWEEMANSVSRTPGSLTQIVIRHWLLKELWLSGRVGLSVVLCEYSNRIE